MGRGLGAYNAGSGRVEFCFLVKNVHYCLAQNGSSISTCLMSLLFRLFI